MQCLTSTLSMSLMHTQLHGHHCEHGQRAVGALRELKRRWEGVTLHLHSFQEPAVRQVTRQRDIGFIALLMIFTSWADTSFPYGPTGWSEGCQRWDMHRRMASFLNSQLR